MYDLSRLVEVSIEGFSLENRLSRPQQTLDEDMLKYIEKLFKKKLENCTPCCIGMANGPC